MPPPPELLPVPPALTRPPAMPVPWPTVPLDYGPHAAFLQNIQGNILKSHGRDFARLIFWQCDWSGRRPAGFWSEIFANVTTAVAQKNQALNRLVAPNDVFRSFALTARGMHALGVPDESKAGGAALAHNPAVESPFTSFNTVANPAPQTPASAPAWARSQVDALWQVACADETQLAHEITTLTDLGARYGLSVTGVEPLIRNDNREPFGFKDGISVSGFFQDDQDPAKPRMGGPWADLDLPRVLVGPGVSLNRLHEGGSLLVVQKLEQNVQAFRAFEQSMLPGVPEAGSLLIGRTRDGDPLVPINQPVPAGVNPKNFFDFESDPVVKGRGKPALSCPFHAHIRKMNTRTNAPNGKDALPGPEVKTALLVRRGMVYDPDGKLGSATPPGAGVGLMFMAYTSNIGLTFEQLAGLWAGDTFVPADSPDGPDPILAGAGEKWQWRARKLQSPQPLAAFVTPQAGALYFYAPPMQWLATQAGLP